MRNAQNLIALSELTTEKIKFEIFNVWGLMCSAVRSVIITIGGNLRRFSPLLIFYTLPNIIFIKNLRTVIKIPFSI